MEDCVLFYAAVGSDPSENPSHICHTRIGSSPLGSSATMPQLPLSDLSQIRHQVNINIIENEAMLQDRGSNTMLNRYKKFNILFIFLMGF